MWWPPPPPAAKTWNWFGIFIVKVRKKSKGLWQHHPESRPWKQIKLKAISSFICCWQSSPKTNKVTHLYLTYSYVWLCCHQTLTPISKELVFACFLIAMLYCVQYMYRFLSLVVWHHVFVFAPWNWTCMIHVVEALEEYQSNMGQQATKEKEQEEGEEEERHDDPSPIDTKPECEVSCKPRCLKQLLHYEVYMC